MGEVTQILECVQPGDPCATDRLIPLVYEELRQLARKKLSREANHPSLQTTALVHEAYLRLTGGDQNWNGRAHFFAAAGEAMRRIIVERAREKNRLKRGGDRRRVLLGDAVEGDQTQNDEILNLHEALDQLAARHPAKADVVKLRYFAGFTTNEAAEALGITSRTAERYWTFAKAWLFREMQR